MLLFAAIATFALAAPVAARPDGDVELFDKAPPFTTMSAAARAQANRTAESTDATAYPTITHKDVSRDVLNTWLTSGAGGWTAGFFPGILWKIAAAEGLTANSTWVKQALRWTEGMRSQQHDTSTHDIGFKIFCSFGQALELAVGNAIERRLEELRYTDVVVTAAHSLATRFNPTVGCTQSWNAGNRCAADPNYTAKFPVIIDNMMNLELLFWAAKNTSNQTLYAIAESHANKTAHNHVRPDGSTFHVVDYDPKMGSVSKRCTAQGLSDNSTWSRGQAWCIYGFTMAYRFTRLPLHLETASKCADFFLSRVMAQGEPRDWVPMWDFAAPGKQTLDYRDASAGAVAASALLELATFAENKVVAKGYRAAALHILTSLEASYLGKFMETQGVLIHSTDANPAWSPEAFNVSLVYAGYYVLEAISRFGEGSTLVSKMPSQRVVSSENFLSI